MKPQVAQEEHGINHYKEQADLKSIKADQIMAKLRRNSSVKSIQTAASFQHEAEFAHRRVLKLLCPDYGKVWPHERHLAKAIAHMNNANTLWFRANRKNDSKGG